MAVGDLAKVGVVRVRSPSNTLRFGLPVCFEKGLGVHGATVIAKRYSFVNSSLLVPRIAGRYDTARMDNKAIRRKNLLDLEREFGTLAALAEATGSADRHLSQMKNGTRGMGDRVARRFEARLGKPRGWMDEVDHASPQTSLEAVKLLEDYNALPDGLKSHVARKTAELRAYADALPDFLRKSLRPPPDPLAYRAWEKEMEADMARLMRSSGGEPAGAAQ